MIGTCLNIVVCINSMFVCVAESLCICYWEDPHHSETGRGRGDGLHLFVCLFVYLLQRISFYPFILGEIYLPQRTS